MSNLLGLTLAASVLMATAHAAATATPLPMPEKAAQVLAEPVEQVQRDLAALNKYIGSYPPHIASAAERQTVYAQWSKVAQRVWTIEAKQSDAETTLVLLSELYRQGHNLDVASSGERAHQAVARCLAAYPNSVPCHFSASYFYLSINPQFASKGEASLIRLRTLLKPGINLDVERGLVFAYLYQGRKDDTLKQVAYFLTLAPDADWASKLREALVSGKVTVEKR